MAREQKIRTRAGREHLLQVYVKRADLGKTEHAMNSLVAALVWDEARFGLGLDLERFMIVAVDDFNFGAMENKGLNLFNTRFVLASADTATDADFSAVESVVAHEYFHNWTGNRITCRDWFQLSLKEGLTVFRDQEFSMDMAGDASARAVKRIEDVLKLRTVQFPEDAGSMAHPVRPDSYLAINNFYTPTIYEKGAEVVRMMHTLVGREGFAKGLALYFQRHDGQAVTCDDFAQAIADANPHSVLAQQLDAFKRWYSRAGTPRLVARGVYDAQAQRYTLQLSQQLDGATQAAPLVIPVAVALFGADGQPQKLQLSDEDSARGSEALLVLDQAQRSWSFVNVASEPVPSLLRGFSAPVVLDDHLGDAQLITLLAHDTDPFNRWEAAQRLSLARLLAAVQGGGAPTLDDAYVQALRDVLRNASLDPAFKSLVLALPGEAYVAEQMSQVDPQRIHAVREQMLDQLAEKLHADWAWAFEQHQVRGGYAPSHAQAGQRALAARALHMLCRHAVRSGDAVWPGRAYQQVKDAGNMSDRLAALSALVNARAAAGRCSAGALSLAGARRRAGHRQVVRRAGARQRRPARPGQCAGRRQGLAAAQGFFAAQPEPRARADRGAVPRQPGRLPPQRRGGLRLLGRAPDRAGCHQPQPGRPPGTGDGSLEPAGRAVSQRGARSHRARGRARRTQQRCARDRRQGAREDMSCAMPRQPVSVAP